MSGPAEAGVTPEGTGRSAGGSRHKPGKDRDRSRRTGGSARAGAGIDPEKGQTDRPGCVLISGQGSCPGWEELLGRFPMIDSVQREDFPEQGASFAYLAHFYRTGDTAEESARAEQEFADFFRAIGYTYRYSGNFESRWFEGIGIRIE